MEELEKKVNAIVDKYIFANPGNGNGTISGMSIRVEYIENNKEIVLKELAELINNYKNSNSDITDSKAFDLKKQAVERFMKSFVLK